jgi:hypothetical protein
MLSQPPAPPRTRHPGFGLGQQILAGKQLQVAPTHPGVLQAIMFGAVAVSLVAIIGVGLGGVIRHTV